MPEWTVGDRLRKARGVAGLTTSELADRIGVSKATVTNAESGRHRARRITLNAWAMATGVSVRWLETGQAPTGDEPGGGLAVRRQGLEPRTRWFRGGGLDDVA